jgi:hypothetical protein
MLGRTAGALVLDLVYNYQVKGHDDEIVHIVEVASLEFSRAATPGAFLVDSLPFCGYTGFDMTGVRVSSFF